MFIEGIISDQVDDLDGYDTCHLFDQVGFC